MTPKPSSARDRIFEDDVPLIISGRKVRTREVAGATLIASAALPETVIRHMRYDEHGNLIERHVRRIRRVAR